MSVAGECVEVMGEGEEGEGASQCGPRGSSAVGSGSFTAPGWSVASLSGTEGTNVVGEGEVVRRVGEAVRRGEKRFPCKGKKKKKCLQSTKFDTSRSGIIVVHGGDCTIW